MLIIKILSKFNNLNNILNVKFNNYKLISSNYEMKFVFEYVFKTI